MEKHLFKRYKYYVEKQNWLIVKEFEVMLNRFFDYDFSYVDTHYMAIKNEKTIYEYDV